MTTYSDDLSDFVNVSPRPKTKLGRRLRLIEILVVLAMIAMLSALLLPASRTARPAARRAQCQSNLKQIALALLNYESVYKVLPPAFTVDAGGKPLHSWRTLILPYLERQRLYETIDLAKPWNDPANAKAFATTVSAYHCPELDLAGNRTTYLAVVAPRGCFLPDRPRRLSEITDDHGSTLTVIEASPDQTVHWMAPVDADEALVMGWGPGSKLGHEGVKNAAFLDGTVRDLKPNTPLDQRRAMISVSGNDDRTEWRTADD